MMKAEPSLLSQVEFVIRTVFTVGGTVHPSSPQPFSTVTIIVRSAQSLTSVTVTPYSPAAKSVRFAGWLFPDKSDQV